MIRDEDKDEWVLSSGRRMYGFSDTIGISTSDPRYISYGSDGGLEILQPHPSLPGALIESPLTPEERREIAEHMINLWRKFAEAA